METMISKPNELPSSPDRYVHSNDHQWENHTLSRYSNDNKIQTAFRLFECFDGICGFVPYWDREEPPVTVTAAPTSRSNRKKAVEEYWTKSLKDTNSGVYKKDLKFLEGNQSGYKESHEYVHPMSVALSQQGCRSISYYFRWVKGGLQFIEGFGNI